MAKTSTQLPAVTTVQVADLALVPVLTSEQAEEALQMLQTFIAKNMFQGVDKDYGTMPGTDKKMLFKPGAEKLMEFYGFYCDYAIDKEEENYDVSPFRFMYRVKATVKRKVDERTVATGLGIASTWETKHRSRTAKRECPSCGHEIRTSKDGNGFYCWAKTGGCGLTFGINDPNILDQPLGMVDNANTVDQQNTVLKMAEVRAMKFAVIAATRSSALFDHDVIEEGDRISVQVIDESPKSQGENTPAQNAAQSTSTVASSGATAAQAGDQSSPVDVQQVADPKSPAAESSSVSAAAKVEGVTSSDPKSVQPAAGQTTGQATTAQAGASDVSLGECIAAIKKACEEAGYLVSDLGKIARTKFEIVDANRDQKLPKVYKDMVDWFQQNKSPAPGKPVVFDGSGRIFPAG